MGLGGCSGEAADGGFSNSGSSLTAAVAAGDAIPMALADTADLTLSAQGGGPDDLFFFHSNASDWAYVNEGRKYLVCRFIGGSLGRLKFGSYGDSSTSEVSINHLTRLHGRVIRFLKISSSRESEVNDDRAAAVHSSSPCSSIQKMLSDELVFTRMIIERLFGRIYIAGGKEVVAADRFFMRQLSENISSLRPPQRRRKSDIILSDDSSKQAYSVILEDDVGAVRRQVKGHSGEQVSTISNVSAEIKIKCGLSSSSPFLYKHIRKRRFKLSTGRFAQSQIYKFRCMAEDRECRPANHPPSGRCEWGSFQRVSEYNPMDLCSADRKRAFRALEALYSNPQNNFRITCCNTLVHSWDVDGNGDGIGLSELFTELSSVCTSKQYRYFLDILVEILCVEDLAHTLQIFQIDPLDAEGVEAIYSRLLYLSRSDENSQIYGFGEGAINGYIDSEVYSPHFNALVSALIRARGMCEQNSSSEAAIHDETMSRLLDKLLSLQISDSMTDQEMQIRYNESVRWVDSLDACQCASFLNMYLLSLLTRDASIVVSIGNRETCHKSVISVDANKTVNAIQSLEVLEKQTSGCDGCLQICYDNGLIIKYAFRISLIDLSPKPASKIGRKIIEEEYLCNAQLASKSEPF